VYRLAWAKWRERGIGANLAFRLDVLRHLGPFDEELGPGAPLPACEEGDLAYRLLRAGVPVLIDPTICVMHDVLRTWDDGQRFMRDTGVGIAAAHMKQLRMGDIAVIPVLLAEWLRCVRWRRALLFRSHSGLARFGFYAVGILVSFRYQIDRQSRTYVVCPSVPISQEQPATAAMGGLT
jgi:hypothetical protein